MYLLHRRIPKLSFQTSLLTLRDPSATSPPPADALVVAAGANVVASAHLARCRWLVKTTARVDIALCLMPKVGDITAVLSRLYRGKTSASLEVYSVAAPSHCLAHLLLQTSRNSSIRTPTFCSPSARSSPPLSHASRALAPQASASFAHRARAAPPMPPRLHPMRTADAAPVLTCVRLAARCCNSHDPPPSHVARARIEQDPPTAARARFAAHNLPARCTRPPRKALARRRCPFAVRVAPGPRRSLPGAHALCPPLLSLPSRHPTFPHRLSPSTARYSTFAARRPVPTHGARARCPPHAASARCPRSMTRCALHSTRRTHAAPAAPTLRPRRPRPAATCTHPLLAIRIELGPSQPLVAARAR
ncbi:hypothetical protein GGX14DRAFT_677377 [Mycena pura]|uniref:Uncharacterized protein n=1 Tax=Mycena pura TaxID=153505 RepID=A0AAD6Y3P7_9AGAR|nr:hypothetical protein GGX14DRAFT_677377 [Mycena pura]